MTWIYCAVNASKSGDSEVNETHPLQADANFIALSQMSMFSFPRDLQVSCSGPQQDAQTLQCRDRWRIVGPPDDH